ncbi:MAG: sigma-54 dependent transcriptional regulator [Bryobacteraceae bacterium]
MRLVICSKDYRLQPLLASALAPDFTVLVEADREKVKQLVAGDRIDVLILDLDSNCPSISGELAFVDEIRDGRLPIVVMTDDSSRAAAMQLLERGVYDCFRKPPSLIELKIVVRRAYEHSLVKRELAKVREAVESVSMYEGLVGSSGRSQVVYDLIRRVADLNAFVLIGGESGTGKELVARAIHNVSCRKQHPFVAVSCGAIPEALIEAELFGHERGAFTGTAGAREGYFEQAGEGTLLLDEIGELSLQIQVKLLRVLQQREFSRLGSGKLLPLKARVLFATHRDLERMVEEGAFRRDLFFRVNVMRIQVPALRHRTEDIPALAGHFLSMYAKAYDKPVFGIQPTAMQMLVEYDWPGNIRELENAIQRAVIIADGDSIGPRDLPEHLEQPGVPVLEVKSNSFEDQLRQYKITLANKAIVDSNGNKTLAARSLKISRAYLHRLVRNSEDAA